MSEHRKRLRAAGLRPIQVWVPDVRSIDFAAEANRQALLVAKIDAHSDDQAFVEAISDTWDD